MTPPVAAEQDKADAWKDAHRDDIVAILGQPNKARKSGDGEVLQDKLFRMHVDSRPAPGVLLIEVPGLGKKIKLKFRPDADGRVVEWTVSRK